MNSCIFSNKCIFARHAENQILYEDEFLATNETLFARKIAFSRANIPSDCTEACPVYTVTNYLLKKNRLIGTKVASMITDKDIKRCQKLFEDEARHSEFVVISPSNGRSTAELADIITYYGICMMWKGSGLETVIYNLNFAIYQEEMRKSWGVSNSDSYTDYDFANSMIESKSESGVENVLIVSGIDYVNFKDHTCETFLQLIGKRTAQHLPLIIVSPNTSSLIGEGPFFGRLTDVLNKHRVTYL